MSEYTESRSKPGNKTNAGTDDRQLWLTEFGGTTFEAWEETVDYGDEMTYVRNITQGKADTFPIIGRKRDATDHEPGEVILGGRIEGNDVEITLDKMLIDSVFIAEVDDLMAHFSLWGPYARQLGESLGTTYCKRIARMHILASRVTTRPYEDGPLPNGYFHADVDTDPAHMENAIYAGVEWIKRFDIGGGALQVRLPWSQYLNLAKYTGIDKVDTSGSGDRSSGSVGKIAGLVPQATNHIPKTNVTTGLPKYRGDFSATIGHISNQMAVGTLARRGLKVVQSEKDDRLGTLMIASKFNGHGILRPECSFEIATSDATSLRGANHPDKDL